MTIFVIVNLGAGAQAAGALSVDAPPAPPGGRIHEGVFLRLAVGPAYTSLRYSTSGSRINGFGAAMNLAFGGAVRPGIVLAASIQGARYWDPTLTGPLAPENARDLSLKTFGVAFLVDYYPDPQGGVHFGGEVGVAGTVLRDTREDDLSKHDPTGTSWGAHVGYELWIADQWSLGGLLKVNYLRLSRDMFATPSGVDLGFGLSGFQPLLLVSCTHN